MSVPAARPLHLGCRLRVARRSGRRHIWPPKCGMAGRAPLKPARSVDLHEHCRQVESGLDKDIHVAGLRLFRKRGGPIVNSMMQRTHASPPSLFCSRASIRRLSVMSAGFVTSLAMSPPAARSLPTSCCSAASSGTPCSSCDTMTLVPGGSWLGSAQRQGESYCSAEMTKCDRLPIFACVPVSPHAAHCISRLMHG